MPSCSSARSPFTSGTTSGTPSCSRKAADLSTQIAPPRTACGTSSRLAREPTEKRQRSRSPAASASGVASSTTRPSISLPAERADANRRTSSKPRSRKRSTITRADCAGGADDADPQACWRSASGASSSKAWCSAATAVSTSSVRDVAGDLDRRGRHDLGLDAGVGQRREHLRRHARVALHARADHADLAEVVARAPLRRRARRAPPCAASRSSAGAEKTISGAGLDDRVDVHARVR